MKLLLQFCVFVLLSGLVSPCTAATSLVDHYRKALGADPQNLSLRYHLGIALLNQGENLPALQEFRAVYPTRTNDPEINFNLALVYLRLKDPDSALIYLDQASGSGAAGEPEVYPLQNVYFNLVLLYAEQGQLGEAVTLLNRLIAAQAPAPEYLKLLGDYQLRLGRIEAAVATFVSYLTLVPEDRELQDYAFAALVNLGLAAQEKQDYAGARREFMRALQIVENSPLVFYSLSLLDYQQEKYAAVAGRLPEIYALLNSDQQGTARSILYNTALALKQKGQLADAQKALLPLTSALPPRAKDLSLLAGIQLEHGDYALARQTYSMVLQLDPARGDAAKGIQAAEKGAFNVLLDAAGAAFAADDLAAVRSSLEQAAEIYPGDSRLRIYQARLAKSAREGWTALYAQAEQFERQQRYVDALTALRKALQLEPTESSLVSAEKRLLKRLSVRLDELYQQGRTLYAAQDLRAAQRTFQQLVALNPAHKEGGEYLQRTEDLQRQGAQRALGAGEAALDRGDLHEARQDFQLALKMWPADGTAEERLKRTEELIAVRVAEILMQARRARTEGRLPAARELLRNGFAEWPDSRLQTALAQIDKELHGRQQSLVQLVREAIRKQNFTQAIQLLAQAKLLSPDSDALAGLSEELKRARAHALERQLIAARREVAAGNFTAGLKAYRQALDLDLGNAEALAGLQKGRSALSATIAQLLVEGSAAHQAGQFEQARQAYRRVLALDPHQADALDAMRKIERAGKAGLTGRDSTRLYLQGIELYTEGDYKQAIAVWQQVLDLDPGHEKARMNIDKAERKLRQIQERKSG